MASHMFYVYMIVLYDKMGYTFKQLHNINTKLYEEKAKYMNEDDETVTRQSLLNYSIKKNAGLIQFVENISSTDIVKLANVKKLTKDTPEAAKYGLLNTLLLMYPILKENYKFSQAKTKEFLKWVAYAIHMYNTKLPGEGTTVYSDEYIRQIFIEDEHWDFKTGEKTA